MDDEWLSASAALDLITTIVPIGAAQAICMRASDGLIEARAKRLIIGDEAQDHAAVPKALWWARGELALRQNWAAGDFETWIDRTAHWCAYGVEFRRQDIEAMLPSPHGRRVFARAKSGNYASATRCVDELCHSLGCAAFEAERLILRGCRAGLVPSRCKELKVRIRSRYGEDNQTEQNVEIPEWFWDYCLDHADTVLNWRTNQFSGRGSTDGYDYRAVILGVEFQVGSVVEIEAMEIAQREGRVASLGDNEETEPRIAAPAGRRLSENWRPWVAELVAHIHDHGIPAGVGSQGQEELINAVATAIAGRGDEGLSRSTVQPVVQAVLDRLRAAGN